jgi:hypothetical protein
MCNRFFAFIRNLWMPANIKKEIEKMHDATISFLWNELYDKIFIIGEKSTTEEFIIRFPLDRIYEIDGYWKKYNYETLDFYFYKLKLNTVAEFSYKSMPIKVDFYSDGVMGFLEISRRY